MARPLRIEYAGAFYHVMNRGADRQSIFIDSILDRALFLKTLGDAVQLWKLCVHAYSLMDNHYHLLIETPLGNLSRAMRHLDGVFTQRFNRRHSRDGALFRGRYKSILVEKETYFLELIRYIHLNGVRAQQYSDPFHDPHASHRAYLNAPQRPPWLTTKLALSFFEDDPDLFDAHVRAGVPDSLDRVLSKQRLPAILGRDAFIHEIRRRFGLHVKSDHEKPQERETIMTVRLNPSAALVRIAKKFNIAVCDLRRRNSQRHGMVRQIAMFVLRRACLCSYREIGAHLGGLGDSAASYGLRQFQLRQLSGDVEIFLKEEFGLTVEKTAN